MQAAGAAAEELVGRGPERAASVTLPLDLQLHLGPYGGRHAGGGVAVHMEVQCNPR